MGGGQGAGEAAILADVNSLPLPMKRIVALISGRGSNLEAIHQRCRSESWPAQIVAVVSNRPQAAGLTYAATHGIATAVVDHKAFADRGQFDLELGCAIEGFAPDLVVLAGFMRILGEALVGRYEGRMLNVHPSLLPAFTGLHTHRRALEAGCKAAGATVHFVMPQLDHGPIVAQAVVPVLPDDDEATLSARVLAREHRIYPRAVRWFVEGKLVIERGIVRQIDGEPQLDL